MARSQVAKVQLSNCWLWFHAVSQEFTRELQAESMGSVCRASLGDYWMSCLLAVGLPS